MLILRTAGAVAALAIAATSVAATVPAGARPVEDRAGAVAAPIGGGSGINFARHQPITAGGYSCTMTAVGHDRHGNLVGLTNAHCFYDTEGNQFLGDKVYRDLAEPGSWSAPQQGNQPDLATGVIGTVVHISGGNPISPGPNGVGLDYAVITLDEQKVRPTATVRGTTITRIGPAPGPGTRMCKQGRTTNLTCGFRLFDLDEYFTHTIYEAPGDSGSPVVHGQTLVGNAWIAGGSTSMVRIVEDLNKRGGIGAGFTVSR